MLWQILASLTGGSLAGEVAILSSTKLTPVNHVRAGHMVFVTAVVFAPSSTALLRQVPHASQANCLAFLKGLAGLP